MALTRQQKEAQVKELTEKFKSAQSVMFAHYIGLSVAEINELRNQLKEEGAEMRVAKKTLMMIAAKESNIPKVDADLIEGPVSCIFSFTDPLSGAQVAFKFGKDHEQVQILGGIFDGKVLSKEEAIELAKIPGRSTLLATFASMLRSPLVNFAGICNSPLSGFARAVSEIADKGGFGDEEVEKEGKGGKEEDVEDSKDSTESTEPEPESKNS